MHTTYTDETPFGQGWNLACRQYVKHAPQLTETFIGHCLRDLGKLDAESWSAAWNGFAVAWRYLDANLAFTRTTYRNHASPWPLFTGDLLACANQAASLFYYQTEEDQGNHDWRVSLPRLADRYPDLADMLEFGLSAVEFATWVHGPGRLDVGLTKCLMEFDPGSGGQGLDVDEAHLWVFAAIYVAGTEPLAKAYQDGREPIARIYRYDFPPEEENDDM